MTLRFQFELSPAALDLLEEAFELTIDSLREGLEYGDGVELSWVCPVNAELMSAAVVIETLEALRAQLRTRERYGLSEYHWLLIYEVLYNQIEIWNDGLKGSPPEELPPSIFAGHGELWVEHGPPRRLDFDSFVDQYFWDDDFLLAPGEFEGLSTKQKGLLRLTDSTFGAIHRIPPHPEDLELRRGEGHR